MRHGLARIEDIVCLAALVVMTALTFANVVARYVFSASFSFSEEITTYLFVLLSLVGSAVAARRKAHLGFTALLDMASPALRRKLSLVSFSLALVFSASLFYYGCQMAASQFSRGQVTAGMQLPEWIFGAFVPLGAFFITAEFFFLLKDLLSEGRGESI